MTFTAASVAHENAPAPPLGAATFWDLLRVLDEGKWASCYSCIEFYYAQSSANAALFLDAAATTGFLDKVPLAGVLADVGAVVDVGLVEILALPIFVTSGASNRKAEAKVLRRRAESIVGDLVAYSRLKQPAARVDAAFRDAVTSAGGRLSDRAVKKRWDTDMSSVARFRLLLEVERSEGASFTVAKRTVTRAVRSGRRGASPLVDCDPRFEEIEQFVLDYLAGAADRTGGAPSPSPVDPTRYLPLVHEVARQHCRRLMASGMAAQWLSFLERWRAGIEILVAAMPEQRSGSEEAIAMQRAGGRSLATRSPLPTGFEEDDIANDVEVDDLGFVVAPPPRSIRRQRFRLNAIGRAVPPSDERTGDGEDR